MAGDDAKKLEDPVRTENIASLRKSIDAVNLRMALASKTLRSQSELLNQLFSAMDAYNYCRTCDGRGKVKNYDQKKHTWKMEICLDCNGTRFNTTGK